MGRFDTLLTPSVRFEEILSDGSTLDTPAAGSRYLFLGDDSAWHDKDEADAVGDIGGSGSSPSTLGTTTLGGSFDGARGAYFKKITIASTKLLHGIAIGAKGDGTNPAGLAAYLHADNAGAVGNVIGGPLTTLLNDNSAYPLNLRISATARFIFFPMTGILTAADYWISGRLFTGADNLIYIAYDNTNVGDKFLANASAFYATDGSIAAPGANTHDHSLYAIVS